MVLGFFLPNVLELVILLALLLATVFWIWMLVDCATSKKLDGTNRIVWAIIICLASYLGAILYFCIVRSRRGNSGGSGV